MWLVIERKHTNGRCPGPQPPQLSREKEDLAEHFPLPPPPMSNPLGDLKKHIPDQTLRIDQIINSPDHFSDSGPDVSTWSAARDSLWGKGLASLDDPLSGAAHAIVKIPETMPDLWGLDLQRILVQPQYKEIERAALSASAKYVEAFLVSGQPGTGPPPLALSSAELDLQTGKSVFLMWLLMRRLALGLPTALQVRADCVMLFHEGGTSQFLFPERDIRYLGLKFPQIDCSKRIWALVDSNQHPTEHVGIFCYRKPFFVVEAVSPRQEGLDWIIEVYPAYYDMKPWTSSEVPEA
jgi:hypothetical protein